MNKIIAAFDGFKISAGTINYAVYLAKHYNAHLAGVFLDDTTYTSYGYKDIIEKPTDAARLKTLDDTDKKMRDEAVHIFTGRCHKEGINFSLHRDRNTALDELLHESVYADLVIIDKGETFSRAGGNAPSSFMRNLLAEVQCPVLVVPDEYKEPGKVIFLFDGEPSSVYAVKMFTYILAPYKQLPLEVLSVKGEEESLHVPDNKLVKEFLNKHFQQAAYTVLKGLPEERIVAHLAQQQTEPLIVLGAYRRGKVSRWFRPSMADVLIQHTKSALFIAHNK
ncbi:MAG TPA: universal stress protein [Chitinophagaceae bacterium]|nr:universal stress protein [Chitinophagaceae bacterium]